MTDSSTPASASSRHWLYGFNVVLIAVIAFFLVGLADYFTNTHSRQFDWSTGAFNSLSPKSLKLVQEVDRKIDEHVAALKKEGQAVPERDTHYELINLFSHGRRTKTARPAQQVDDLLHNYVRESRHIVVTVLRGRKTLRRGSASVTRGNWFRTRRR